ncbi:MAG: EamA family transporter [Bacteroidales bacterium]|nr:EamA family transporter [Bacteroidales bacterium]
MSWIFFAVLTAVFRSLTDVAGKFGLKKIDEYIVAWALNFFALPLLIPVLFFIEIPDITPGFWLAILVSGTLNIATAILYLKAIKLADLSLITPLSTFTPLFLLITSPVIVGEFPGIFGLIGIFLIVFGSYILNIKEKKNGLLAPFKALIGNKGAQLMLLVAFIWSITSNFDKIGLQNSSPVFYGIAVNIFITIGITPLVFFKSKKNIKQIPKNLKSLIPVGIFHGLMIIFHMIALSMTLVAYLISIKRTSAIISVLFGVVIFKEKGLKERILGAIIMIIGVLCITLF